MGSGHLSVVSGYLKFCLAYIQAWLEEAVRKHDANAQIMAMEQKRQELERQAHSIPLVKIEPTEPLAWPGLT